MIATPETRITESDSELTPFETNPAPNGRPKPLPKSGPEETPGENLYLTGRPTLRRFLRFVRSNAVNPADEGTLTDEWHAANEVARTLEKEEAGAADNPPITKLDVDKYEPLLTEFLKDPLVRNNFNTVPTEVAFIELDRLVVYQHHIDLAYVRLLERELGPTPSEEQIFRTSLLHDHPRPPVKWARTHWNSYVFMSPSNDVRFLGTMKLKAENIKDYPPPGDLAGVVGLAFGFGSNFLNAVYTENRLILNNGSHRAYALRKIGVTHVPCIIQHVTSLAKLDVVAGSEIMDNLDYFLKSPRPSMLRDYFNPKLHKVMPVHRKYRQLTVKFEIDDMNVPAF
jgi:hypothetical protein